MKTRIVVIILLLASSAFVFSCRERFDLAQWQVHLKFPIAKGTISIFDLVNSQYLVTDPVGLLRLQVDQSLFSLGLSDLVGLPDTSQSSEFTIPVSIPIFPGVPFYSDEQKTDYNLEDVRLYEAVLQEADIEVEIKNTIDKAILFKYSIRSANLNGDTFFIEELIAPNSTFFQTYSLSGYALDLTGEDGSAANTLLTKFSAELDLSEPGAYNLKAGDRFEVTNTIKNIVPDYVRGFFGSRQVDIIETDSIQLFEAIKAGELDIAEFDVGMSITNGIGCDLALLINDISALNASTSNGASLQHILVGNPQYFGRAIDLFQTPAEVIRTLKAYQFSESNSNLDELLETIPDLLAIDLSVQVNPQGDISYGNDFVHFGKDLEAKLSLDVPLTLGARGIVFSDTLAFNFQTESEVERLNNGTVIVYADNGYPLGADIQLYVLDSSANVIDSLLETSQPIEAALYDQNSTATTSVRSKVEVTIDQDKIGLWERGKNLLLVGALETSGNGKVVKFESGQSLRVEVVGDFNIDTE